MDPITIAAIVTAAGTAVLAIVAIIALLKR